MASGAVPFKTPAGQAGLSARQRRVSQRHRTVLFLIDGKRSAAEVCRLARLAGAPEICFDELLAQGLIASPAPLLAVPADVPAEAETLHVDLPLQAADSMTAALDSTLPPSRTLQPESTLSAESMRDEARGLDPWAVSQDAAADAADAVEGAVAEARELLMNAVRTQAPVAGSLTLLRLRRAGGRAELTASLGEVEARLNRPRRSVVAAQMLPRVRALLGEPIDSTLSLA